MEKIEKGGSDGRSGKGEEAYEVEKIRGCDDVMEAIKDDRLEVYSSKSWN